MITFKDFLLEDLQPLVEYLDRHCEPFLKELFIDPSEVEDYPLWRGIEGAGGQSITLLIDGQEEKGLIKAVRKDRKPLDTHPDISTLIDDAFEQRFGWRPRSQGMFAYGKEGKDDAEVMYGRLYQVFPIGEFKYIWSPKVSDLFTNAANMITSLKLPRRRNDQHFSKEELEPLLEPVADIVSKYQDTGLKKAITGPRREIMIDCNSYLAVPR